MRLICCGSVDCDGCDGGVWAGAKEAGLPPADEAIGLEGGIAGGAGFVTMSPQTLFLRW